MTKTARISDNQAVALEDFQNLARLPRDNLDALIRAAVETGQSYAGGTVTKTGTSQVTVDSPVFLFKAGALYSTAGAATVVDMLGLLPTSGNRRVVAILLQAQEFNDQARPRDFEIDGSVYPPLMDPQSTETVTWRKAAITQQAGDAAPSPSRPVVDAANTVLAWVTLSSTEVVEVVQNVEARIVTVRQTGQRVVTLETWRATAEPTLDGLKADVSKLNAASRGKADRGFLGYMLEQLARLNETVGVGQDASYSRSNYFLDQTDSDLDHINFRSKVEEGMRLPDDNSDRSPLALEMPGDSRFQIVGGMLLPKYTERGLIVMAGLVRDAEVAVSNAGAQTINYTKRTVARTRTRWGNSYTVCTNAQWWLTGRYDSVSNTFHRDGETFSVLNPEDVGKHVFLRVQQFWEDSWEETYWDAVTVPASYTGNVAAQTFVMPTSAWVTSIDLCFSRVDTGGDVRLVLVEVHADGTPNYAKAIADVTVAAADLKVYGAVTKFPLTPVYLEGGRRYAWAIITAGNHWLAMYEGNRYSQGTFFTSTDGVWSQGNISQDAIFILYGAVFDAPRLVVNLNDFNLSGGIADIDLDLEQVVPAGTGVTFEVQVGSAWKRVESVPAGNHPLYGLPASVNARMTLLGTTDVMPGIKVASSFVTLSRPSTTGTHISEVHTAPSNVDEVRVISLLEYYDEADHNCTVSLLMGAGYATAVAASSSSDEVLADGSIRRTSIFTGFAATASWKVKTVLATTSALSVFHVAEQTDIAFPA